MKATSMEGHIPAVLEEDAKASYTQVVDRTDVSRPTVRKYIRRLEDSDVIVSYSVDINPKKLAGQSIATAGIDATNERYIKITRTLEELDSVETPYTSSGDCVPVAEVRVVDGDPLGDIVFDEILSIDGVTATRPSFLQERLK